MKADPKLAAEFPRVLYRGLLRELDLLHTLVEDIRWCRPHGGHKGLINYRYLKSLQGQLAKVSYAVMEQYVSFFCT
jgi:hypothetical protein